MPGAMNSVKLGSFFPYTGSFQRIGSWWRSVGSWQVERKLAVELERVSTTHLCKLRATCWLLMSRWTSTWLPRLDGLAACGPVSLPIRLEVKFSLITSRPQSSPSLTFSKPSVSLFTSVNITCESPENILQPKSLRTQPVELSSQNVDSWFKSPTTRFFGSCPIETQKKTTCMAGNRKTKSNIAGFLLSLSRFLTNKA